MPPSTRRQQRYVFAQAAKGVPWAKRWVSEGATKVQPGLHRHLRKRRKHR